MSARPIVGRTPSADTSQRRANDRIRAQLNSLTEIADLVRGASGNKWRINWGILSTIYQPLDSDLTAIAALSTTAFGRGLLTLADAAALRAATGAGLTSSAFVFSDGSTLLSALAVLYATSGNRVTVSASANGDTLLRLVGNGTGGAWVGDAISGRDKDGRTWKINNRGAFIGGGASDTIGSQPLDVSALGYIGIGTMRVTGSDSADNHFYQDSTGQNIGFSIRDGQGRSIYFKTDTRRICEFFQDTGSTPGFRRWGTSSTTTNREMAKTIDQWIDNTDATRKARAIDYEYDTAPRECLRREADGSRGTSSVPCGGSTSTARVGGTIFDHFADAGNGTTVETDLYSDTLAASTLSVNGDKVEAQYAGVFVSSGTATRQIKIYFGGTLVFDSGALTLSLSSAWDCYVTCIRVSSSVVRVSVSMTTEGAALAAYTAYTEVTGLTLTNTQIVKITGTAAGVGAATNDIVAKLGTVKFFPAA